jgi:hypothetical protein
MQSTITLTFGDQAENHVGMQKIGQMAEHGLSYQDLVDAKVKFEKIQCVCELVDMTKNNIPAYLLIVRNALNKMSCGADQLLEEQNKLKKDTKALMYGRVVNKIARHNLCFSDQSQEPDYSQGKGTIIAFSNVPHLNELKNRLQQYFDQATNLTVEGNYYYDVSKCGISFHGDTERKIVIGVRLGHSMPLHFQWFYKSKPVGERYKFNLNHGDLYVMSEKAVGFDWKQKTMYTLRHAAGADKFLEIKL